MQSDIEIARKIPLKPIDVAAAGLAFPKARFFIMGPSKPKST